MIDTATWRARIGLYRVCAGPSGRRAKVLRLIASYGAADWCLLLAMSTIKLTVELVVTVIIILLVLSGDTGRYYYLQPAASITVNPGLLIGEYSNLGSRSIMSSLVRVIACLSVANGNTTHHLVKAATLIPDTLYSKGVVSRTQLMLSGDVEMNPGPGTGEECSCDQWLH